MTVTADLLRTAYEEVMKKDGIGDYVVLIRENPEQRYKVKRAAMKTLLDNSATWDYLKTGSGHHAWKNKITGITVGFQGHSSTQQAEIPASQAVALMDTLQEHINILGNDIFRYRTANWKSEPDFDQALKNYQRMGNVRGSSAKMG